MAWPTQVHVNLISLLGKKDGNTRCIAIATTLYRLVMAMCKPLVRNWDKEVGHNNDSALAGRKPLLETVKRAAHMEAGYVRKRCVIAVLWDAEKFFDSLDISTLVSRAVDLGFPPEVMVLDYKSIGHHGSSKP